MKHRGDGDNAMALHKVKCHQSMPVKAHNIVERQRMYCVMSIIGFQLCTLYNVPNRGVIKTSLEYNNKEARAIKCN